jgi:hypothetical protein
VPLSGHFARGEAYLSTQSTPEGPGSVSGAPNLPERFTDTFTSRYVDTGELRLHAVIGGEGPPLLLLHGWPQTPYRDGAAAGRIHAMEGATN